MEQVIQGLIASNFKYTAYFCEENIWHLGRDLIDRGVDKDRLQVLFFFKPGGYVPLFNQRVCEENSPVFWDYHVVLKISDCEARSYICDFDTHLPFVTDTENYLRCTFPLSSQLPPEFRFLIRSVPVAIYIAHFYSDRSHMLADNGEPMAPFPDWPCVNADRVEQCVPLLDYITSSEPLGLQDELVDYQQMLNRYNLLS